MYERAEQSEGSECRGSGKREGKPFFIIFLEKERKKEGGRILLEHAYAHTREGRDKRRDTRHGRDVRHEAQDTRHASRGEGRS